MTGFMKRLGVSLAVLLAVLLPRPTSPDIIKLKNGKVLEGKIAKVTNEIVKVRLPRRGKIFTTFYNRANIESIEKTPDEVTRAAFRKAGVRNPGRDFEPVYYGGVVIRSASAGGARRPGARAPRPTASKKRGVEARRERFKSGLRRFAKEETSSRTSTSSSAAGSTTTGISSSSASPSSTGSAVTTR